MFINHRISYTTATDYYDKLSYDFESSKSFIGIFNEELTVLKISLYVYTITLNFNVLKMLNILKLVVFSHI